MWDTSPIELLADVMWAEPDGLRVLRAAPRPAAFITAMYQFDRVMERVETFDTSPAEVDEWFRARSVRRVRALSVRGPRDLGGMSSLEPSCGFGFREPPRFPTIAEVRPLPEDRRNRRTSRRVVLAIIGSLVAMVAGMSVVGCGSSGAGLDEPGADSVARTASVMVGRQYVLAPDDVTAVNVIGLDLVTLATPLRIWWATFEDPEVGEAAWLTDAPRLLDAMRSTVAHISEQLGPGRDTAVRATFTPYVQQWNLVLDALESMRAGVRAGNAVAQQQATDDYNASIAKMGRLDAQRVARVVDAYGRDEAKRTLAAQGLDPTRFGLG